jgi:hypothetical protein
MRISNSVSTITLQPSVEHAVVVCISCLYTLDSYGSVWWYTLALFPCLQCLAMHYISTKNAAVGSVVHEPNLIIITGHDHMIE